MNTYNITQIDEARWGVMEVTNEGVARIVFEDTTREGVECMCEEFQILEQARENDLYLNQLTEFDYV